jgi:hypothetical protein
MGSPFPYMEVVIDMLGVWMDACMHACRRFDSAVVAGDQLADGNN